MDSEREDTRSLMRSTIAEMDTARTGRHAEKVAALLEFARASHALQRFHPPGDPIITAILARMLVDDTEALPLYLEALAQNQEFRTAGMLPYSHNVYYVK